MKFRVYDIFADASISLPLRTGCAGYVLVDRRTNQIIDKQYLVIPGGTNNMSEIIAIWMAVMKGIRMLYEEDNTFQLNIFSDSQIGLFGIRDWIFSWIQNQSDDGVFIGSSGTISNQVWYNDAFTNIIASNLRLKFFHQKGHVSLSSQKSLYEAEKTFRASNLLTAYMAGVTVERLAEYNNIVDSESRNVLTHMRNGGSFTDFPNVNLCPQIPISYQCRVEDLDLYKQLINGGINHPLNSRR